MENNQLKTVQKFYPEARALEQTVRETTETANNDLAIPSGKLVCAYSFCSDELNFIQFPANDMNGSFNLGGLGGYPFGGITGMSAFAAHIPVDGAAVLFYGPHMGITADGMIGKINRNGQKTSTNCCGSISAAIHKLLHKEIKKGEVGDEDYQQQIIEQILLNEKERIRQSEQQIVEAAEVIYETISDKIDELVAKTTFPCKHIIKAGGIYINSDKNGKAFWAPKIFEVFKA